jgi:hypothetical protein
VVVQLGVRCSGGLFVKKSVGAVFGSLLENGEPAVLKLFNRRFSRKQLAAMHSCMTNAAAHGFPLPTPKAELFDAGAGISGAPYEYVDGDLRDAHEPLVRLELARSLAQLNKLLARHRCGHRHPGRSRRSRARRGDKPDLGRRGYRLHAPHAWSGAVKARRYRCDSLVS